MTRSLLALLCALVALCAIAALAGRLRLLPTRTTFQHGGAPWPLPGRIEAEDYDQGTWLDPSYHDTTRRSQAPRDQFYRRGDVDIGVDHVLHLADVGWIAPGEWLEYTVNVARGGPFDLTLRVATPLDGRSMQVALDGRDLCGPIPVPNTGGWGSDLEGGHKFEEITVRSLELPPGVHRLRIEAGTGEYTLDWFEFTEARPGR